MATLETSDHLEARSKKGSIKHLQSIPDKAPSNKPDKKDERI